MHFIFPLQFLRCFSARRSGVEFREVSYFQIERRFCGVECTSIWDVVFETVWAAFVRLQIDIKRGLEEQGSFDIIIHKLDGLCAAEVGGIDVSWSAGLKGIAAHKK